LPEQSAEAKPLEALFQMRQIVRLYGKRRSGLRFLSRHSQVVGHANDRGPPERSWLNRPGIAAGASRRTGELIAM
jgi:hypothetical protein